MKVKCRKCGLEWEMDEITFGDVAELQSMKCGVFGNHAILGIT